MTQGSRAGPGAESRDTGADLGGWGWGWGWQWSVEQEREHYKWLPGKIPSLTCLRQLLRLFSPVPSDSLRGLLRPRICLGLSCLFTPAGRTFPWSRPLLKVLEPLAPGQAESTELSRKRSRGEAISSKARALQSEGEDRGGSDQEHNSVAPGRNDSEGSPAAMFSCFSR